MHKFLNSCAWNGRVMCKIRFICVQQFIFVGFMSIYDDLKVLPDSYTPLNFNKYLHKLL